MKKSLICIITILSLFLFSQNFNYSQRVRWRRRVVRRPQPTNILKNIKIVHMNLSSFYFRTGKKLTFIAYIENRGRKTLTNVLINFYIHRKGSLSIVPVSHRIATLPRFKITKFQFKFIWSETGYTTNYDYRHGDYKFEIVVKHKGKFAKKAHTIWGHPHEYMFYWHKP